MALEVYAVPVQGVFVTYAYFVVDAATRHAFLVDPGAQGALLVDTARQQGWTIDKILLTHGHFDHMGAADAVRRATGAPVLAHRLGPQYLSNPQLNLSASHGRSITLAADALFEEGDAIALAANPAARLTVLHTPGHTDDSCVFVIPPSEQASWAIAGDTVYDGGPGLTVFPTGNQGLLMRSLRDKVLTLPAGCELLSGHADPLTVAGLARHMGVRLSRP